MTKNPHQPRFIFFTPARMVGKSFSLPHCSKCLKPVNLFHLEKNVYEYTCNNCGKQEQVILITERTERTER